ncbi:hypothetical protein AMAG_08685 [Allomyces macrogynus ATCC 38327]|uniref:SPRY domain-containing protein n=1 Tax=Allomyces macrogynus (strain ATCC 38327) TaxID=578462 RepID=A0A0L0SM85_ALLM3|nr:hypothetical protein AMAG_08685 [Allomyces macrogynus ATCC 38327]|eukprot:KNE63578.1 hypothetical protein AMAG_08685 [Allomyces macrogynus ATCC 38327]
MSNIATDLQADGKQLSLGIILAIPVIVSVVVVLVAHCVILKVNPSLRDGKGGGKKGPSGKDHSDHVPDAGDADRFFTSNPNPVNTPFPPRVCPQFDAAEAKQAGVTVTQVDGNCFDLAFHHAHGFVAVQANAPISADFNCMQISILDSAPTGVVVGMGFARRPWPAFRMPGWHDHSIAYHTNGRKFANRGGYVGDKFSIAPNANVSVAKDEANTYYLTADVHGEELYLTQGSDPISFSRVLARGVEFRTRSAQYFPTIGANAKCTVRVWFYGHDQAAIRKLALEQEAKYHSLPRKPTGAGQQQQQQQQQAPASLALPGTPMAPSAAPVVAPVPLDHTGYSMVKPQLPQQPVPVAYYPPQQQQQQQQPSPAAHHYSGRH